MTRRILVAAAFVIAAASGTLTAQEVFSSKDEGVTLPSVVRSVKAGYTAAAMDARIEGTVLTDAVVLADGKVGEVRVTQSLDKEYGLDTQAVEAIKQWLFKAGTKDGKAVAVRVAIEITFRLK